jgi:hypothetical protein
MVLEVADVDPAGLPLQPPYLDVTGPPHEPTIERGYNDADESAIEWRIAGQDTWPRACVQSGDTFSATLELRSEVTPPVDASVPGLGAGCERQRAGARRLRATANDQEAGYPLRVTGL